MKKVFFLTTVFIVALAVAVHFRNNLEGEYKIENNSGAAKEVEQENRSDGPLEFLKFHQGIRTRSDEQKPSYPVNYQMTEVQKAQRLVAKKSIAARVQSGGNGVINYTERGPGNIPGRTRGLIVDPDDATHKTWFAGSASGGIWKTTNAGSSWQWLTPAIANMATTSLAMAGTNHNIIYAGTGEGFGLLEGVNGNGIYKSADRGNSWSFLSNSAPLGNVNRLALDPSNENNILAASNSGIYHSLDGGNTWTQVFDGVVQDLRQTPGNFSILYATQNRVGVLKSTDGGTTWNLSSAAAAPSGRVTNPLTAGMSPSGRIEIALSPLKPDRIIASAEGSLSGVNSDLYLSDDGGVTWYLVTLSLSNKTVDYLGDQGWYNNTVAFSPYDQNVVYIGGVSAFQVTLGAPSSGSSGSYALQENNTSSFITLVNFGASNDGGKLEIGSAANQDSIQVRFGPGLSQKAHRFLVPIDSTSGVSAGKYTYQDYVDVPFQVWDVHKNQQMMVSFRDQDRNGIFNLIALNTSSPVATQQSREYIYINNVPYSDTPNPSIATTGGHIYQEKYFFWPVLTAGATWNPSALPVSNFLISYQTINKYSSTVKTVADVYKDYNGVNNLNFVHPDQHNIFPIKIDNTAHTFQLLLANDGGVFLSGISTSPGTTQGEWTKVGNGYNTSQFYGADKKPGAQEYLGGMQDNSTYFTPKGTIASATTVYQTNSQLAGDGFEVLWHTNDINKMIGGSYYASFSRTVDGGTTWTAAITGLTLSGTLPDQNKFPFISKLASSKQAPDILYSVGSEGVWKSTDFGGSWALTSITTGWGTLSTFADVAVSRANASIVWAGNGMSSSTSLFVSTDGGKTFNATTNPNGYTLGNITRIATHPTDEKTAYALFSFAKTAKILMTKDLGQTWTDISGFGTAQSSANGFPDVAVYSLYVRPDNTNIIWAGTEIGIVESLDAGASWSLLTDFPSVSVWEMKGQDNEIVIATHGRGIWTAELALDQNANFPAPVIVNAGTSPQSKFVIQAHLPYHYDSIQVIINSNTAKFIPPDSGVYNIKLSNVPTGSLIVRLIGFKGAAPIYSRTSTCANLSLQPYLQQFYDYFVAPDNFYLNGLSVLSFGESNSSMQSPHNYGTNQDATGTLLVPIIVSAGNNTSLSYQDVAIIRPGSTGSAFGQSSFNDYVLAEATRDGVTWVPLANGYNATSHPNWQAAYLAAQSGDPSLTVTESLDLKSKFSSGDTLLIRFRLHASDETLSAWGWSVDNLYIQQSPTGIEPGTNTGELVAYPNPSKGKVNLNYPLINDSEVAITVWDMAGRNILSQNLGRQSQGDHHVELNLESAPDGIFLIRLKTNQGERVTKVVIQK